VAAVSAYAAERAEQLVAELREIGVVRDVLAGDHSGAVARLLQGMLALAITESFLLATTAPQPMPPRPQTSATRWNRR
jgi:hypothetical protein